MKAILFALAGISLLTTALFIASAPTAVLKSATTINNAEFHALLREHKVPVNGLRDVHYRYSVYKTNKALIESVNAQKLGYTLGVGPFTLYTFAEFKDMMGLQTIGSADAPATVAEDGSSDLKDRQIDWRNVLDVTPVGNQTNTCNAGYAFAVTGALEAQIKKFRGTVTPVSTQQLVDCTTTMGNFGCKGGYATIALDYLTRTSISNGTDYAYTGRQGTCAPKDEYARVIGYKKIRTEADIMQALEVKPAILAFEYDSGMQHYSDGIYLNRSGACGANINHFALGVGYGFENSGNRYYIVKNSFGTSWGRGGYMLLDMYTCGVSRNTYGAALKDKP